MRGAKRPGVHNCSCGRSISGNKASCFDCSMRFEYLTLIMLKAAGKEIPVEALNRLEWLHAESIKSIDWRMRLVGFAFRNIRMHHPERTYEQVAARIEEALLKCGLNDPREDAREAAQKTEALTAFAEEINVPVERVVVA